MNSWMRRSAAVALLSAGLVAAGSSGAQAAEWKPLDSSNGTTVPAGFLTPSSNTATSATSNVFNNQTFQQAGLVAINVSPSIQIGFSGAEIGGGSSLIPPWALL